MVPPLPRRRPRQPRQLLWLLVDPSLIRNATPAILSPVRCLRLSLMSLSIIGQTLRSRHRHRSLLSSVTGLIGFISHRNRLSALLFEPSLCPALLCSLSAVHFSFELLPWLVAFAALVRVSTAIFTLIILGFLAGVGGRGRVDVVVLSSTR